MFISWKIYNLNKKKFIFYFLGALCTGMKSAQLFTFLFHRSDIIIILLSKKDWKLESNQAKINKKEYIYFNRM